MNDRSIYDLIMEKNRDGAETATKIINSFVLPAICGGGVIFIICMIIIGVKFLITGE